jgi:hypothetical protein
MLEREPQYPPEFDEPDTACSACECDLETHEVWAEIIRKELKTYKNIRGVTCAYIHDVVHVMCAECATKYLNALSKEAE